MLYVWKLISSIIGTAVALIHAYTPCIKHFATVDLKADEEGIIETARELGKELKIVSREEILTVEDMFQGSEFVKKEIGVKAVSEPCAYLTSSKDGKFIEIKAKKDGITISIYEERFIYEKR